MKNKRTSSKVKLSNFNSSVGLDRGASKVKEVLWFVIKILFFQTTLPFPSAFKASLLRLMGARVGRGLVIKPRVNIHFPWKLYIGNDVWIGEEVYILNFERVIIGSNVCISQRSFLCGGNHDFRKPSMPYRNGPIILRDGTWVGACSFIGPNVTVGVDSVITVGSTVLENLEEDGIYKGQPARFVKRRWT